MVSKRSSGQDRNDVLMNSGLVQLLIQDHVTQHSITKVEETHELPPLEETMDSLEFLEEVGSVLFISVVPNR